MLVGDFQGIQCCKLGTSGQAHATCVPGGQLLLLEICRDLLMHTRDKTKRENEKFMVDWWWMVFGWCEARMMQTGQSHCRSGWMVREQSPG